MSAPVNALGDDVAAAYAELAPVDRAAVRTRLGLASDMHVEMYVRGGSIQERAWREDLVRTAIFEQMADGAAGDAALRDKVRTVLKARDLVRNVLVGLTPAQVEALRARFAGNEPVLREIERALESN